MIDSLAFGTFIVGLGIGWYVGFLHHVWCEIGRRGKAMLAGDAEEPHDH